MKIKRVTFPEALRMIVGLSQIGTTRGSRSSVARPLPVGHAKPHLPDTSGREQSRGLTPDSAATLVSESAQLLWSPRGDEARRYLKERGLTEDTIRAAHLGLVLKTWIPKRDRNRNYLAKGIVIPWFEHNRLVLVKIRQPPGRKPRYAQAFESDFKAYPSLDIVKPGGPLIIVEGEMDALLLGQELSGLASVLTLGSASNGRLGTQRIKPSILTRLLTAPTWFIATDSDDAGEEAASSWPARARRVRPPGPCKDWGEAHSDGINLRRWWTDRLGGIEAPVLFTWPDLELQRWGPRAVSSPESAMGPQEGAGPSEMAIAESSDDDAIEERRAIQDESRSTQNGMETRHTWEEFSHTPFYLVRKRPLSDIHEVYVWQA